MQGISNTLSGYNIPTSYEAVSENSGNLESSEAAGATSTTTLLDAWQVQAEMGGSTQSRLAAMVLRFANQRQESNSQQRDAAEAQAQHFEQQQVQQMRDKADQMRSDAATTLAVGLAGAGAQGLTNAGGPVGGAATAHAATANAIGGYLNKVSAIHEQRADARITEAEQDAAAAKRRIDDLASDRGAANDLLAAALDFLTETNQTEAETERAMFIRA
jgi:hypothetical protein